MNRTAITSILAAAALSAVACNGTGTDAPDNLEPRQTEEQRMANSFMVSAAHPLAGAAGLEILRSGGNAVDAAIAIQMVLGFIEAPETGIGGGGFLLYRDGSSGQVEFFDGRETAPAAARAERFMMFGRPLPLWAAIPSGRAVGVPGLLAMLEHVHDQHGTRPWSDLFAFAIEHARGGVPMPARLVQQIRDDRSLLLFSDTRRFFRRQAGLSPPRLQNPALADALTLIAESGAQAFYQGPLGEDFVQRAQSRRPFGSDMTRQDLQMYRAREREPLCGRYRQWTICGPPPPSSAGVALLQMLGMMEQFPIGEFEHDSVDAIHLIAEVSRLAFADRNRYVGDPDHTSVPVDALLDPAYLKARAALIDPNRAMTGIMPGDPNALAANADGAVEPEEETFGTSHFSVIDSAGNALALTSSNESPFGSRMLSNGFLLNNQLTDFTFSPYLPDGTLHPNAPAPDKRPRSSMAPIIVLDTDGSTRLVIGSRGGARIIGYVLKTLLGVLEWQLDIQQAIALPNVLHRGMSLELELGTRLQKHRPALEALGHQVEVVRLTSGLHGIERADGRLRGGADPRLEGMALGD